MKQSLFVKILAGFVISVFSGSFSFAVQANEYDAGTAKIVVKRDKQLGEGVLLKPFVYHNGDLLFRPK